MSLHHQSRSLPIFLLSILWLATAPRATAATAEEARSDYERWQQWRLGPEVALPPDGLSWSRDTATWTFDSGEVRFLEPSSDGVRTGLVFRGEGRFRLHIPDTVEREQLARAIDQPAGETLELTFDEAVLRTSESFLSRSFPAELEVSAEGRAHREDRVYREDKMTRNHHERWLEKHGLDVDARVATGLRTRGDQYLLLDMKSAEHGWLTFSYDGLRREEIQLEQLRFNRMLETWVSLDRAEDRGPEGRPSAERHAILDIEHADLRLDLTGEKRAIRTGRSGIPWIAAQVRATLDFVYQGEETRALQFQLHGLAEVEAVRDPEDRELPFLRDHLGARTKNVYKDVYDSSLVVLFDHPLKRGERHQLVFDYVLLMGNFAPGRGWYPNLPDNFNDLHTADLTFTLEPKQEVRAIGERLRDEIADGVHVSHWRTQQPTKMVSFTYGKRFKEAVLEEEGVPRVVSFGPQVSKGFGGDMIRNVGIDVVQSLGFFQWLFDAELGVEEMHVTGIASGHGQAFEGFLHMSDSTFALENPGASELFRAHESAHQWWGYEVGWHSYRDQWLSESLAEYSAMMYLEARVPGGDEMLREVLQMYTHAMHGSLKGGFSKYARSFLAEVNLSERRRLGPICVGYRAATAEIPSGYTLQAYYKGPLVLHMLRHLLRRLDSADDLFVATLRDFVATYRGKNPKTEDFIATLSRRVPGEWDWFFDQWICGTDIPTYLWSHDTVRGEGGDWNVLLEVEQRNVPSGFRMPVPVELEMVDGRVATYLALVDQPNNTFTIPLPAKPKKILFNPDFAVLAEVKKR